MSSPPLWCCPRATKSVWFMCHTIRVFCIFSLSYSLWFPIAFGFFPQQRSCITRCRKCLRRALELWIRRRLTVPCSLAINWLISSQSARFFSLCSFGFNIVVSCCKLSIHTYTLYLHLRFRFWYFYYFAMRIGVERWEIAKIENGLWQMRFPPLETAPFPSISCFFPTARYTHQSHLA